MAEEYIKRSTRFAKCEMREIDPRRFDPFVKHPAASKIMLDPAGRATDSAAFVQLIGERDLVFVIGGAEGLPAEWKARADMLVSLSAFRQRAQLSSRLCARAVPARAAISTGKHNQPRDPIGAPFQRCRFTQ